MRNGSLLAPLMSREYRKFINILSPHFIDSTRSQAARVLHNPIRTLSEASFMILQKITMCLSFRDLIQLASRKSFASINPEEVAEIF